VDAFGIFCAAEIRRFGERMKQTKIHIPFNKPFMTGKELHNIALAHFSGQLAGDGSFTKRCHALLQHAVGSPSALLTHSCTAALEMQALLLDIQPGDEIIMPSYTFVSTANAFVLRGGVPVFVDIREDTLNIDETLIEQAISTHTRAIAPVHYAGVGCEMEAIMGLARQHGLYVLEDAAQGFGAAHQDKPLGGIGDLGAFSFHETKNIISGEGGALLVNNPKFVRQAEIIREKGTDRSRFFRGEVDKYTWQEVGSSFLPGEIIAAFLYAQLEEAHNIIRSRMKIWEYYHQALEYLEAAGYLRRPVVPEGCRHNAHMYYVLLGPQFLRSQVLEKLNAQGVKAIFHYVPLHSSPAGRRYGRIFGEMKRTDSLAERLIRLPMWLGLTEEQQAYVVDMLGQILENQSVSPANWCRRPVIEGTLT
jgi:dTDP-4-amino-4,6-dideoxygalactose transaminase